MVRGIGDGYYDMPVETSIVPLSLGWSAEALWVVVRTDREKEELAKVLSDGNDFCHESFRTMRV
jgi:hypothetical protein